MVANVHGYRLGASLEPEHPNCTISDPVYAAEGPGGRCVVKILWLGFPLRDASRDRWRDTMTAVQTVSHPCVVRVLGAGFADDGRPYYAMEHVEGETAAVRASRGPTSSAEVSAIIARVAEGIVVAQAAGCAPETDARHIMLAPTGATIWHVGVDRWRTWAQDLVAGQYTCGGGQYMRHPNLTPGGAKGLAPSGARASAQLALIAFNLLAARPYWQADLEMSGSPMEMLMEVVANGGPPPSARSQVPLPAGFDVWFARCLAEQIADPREAAREMPS